MVHWPFAFSSEAVGFRMLGDFRSELRNSSSRASAEPKLFFDCRPMSTASSQITQSPGFAGNPVLTLTSRTFPLAPKSSGTSS